MLRKPWSKRDFFSGCRSKEIKSRTKADGACFSGTIAPCSEASSSSCLWIRSARHRYYWELKNKRILRFQSIIRYDWKRVFEWRFAFSETDFNAWWHNFIQKWLVKLIHKKVAEDKKYKWWTWKSRWFYWMDFQDKVHRKTTSVSICH